MNAYTIFLACEATVLFSVIVKTIKRLHFHICIDLLHLSLTFYCSIPVLTGLMLGQM